MESPFDVLNLEQNQRTTRLLCKACKQNNLSSWHCFKCGNEGHIARFCSEKKGKLREDWGNHMTDLNQMPWMITTDINVEEKM